jgi:UDP-glucose 4-epimerase
MTTREYWAKETVCITGGLGRVGTRMVARLRELPVRDVAVFQGDLLAEGALDRTLDGATTVFHLAARTAVEDSFRDPNAHFRTNTLGTLSLLEACRRSGTRKLVFASTGLVYGIPRELPVPETHATFPLSPYAASKLAAEAALQAYASAFGMAVEVARISNIYGTDNPETVVGRALAAGGRGEDIVVRELETVRDFLHVDDAVEGLLRLAQAGGEPGCRVVNLSTGRGCSIGALLDTLVRVAGEDGGPRLRVRAGEESAADLVPEIVLANATLRARTGWVPAVSLEDGLRRAWAAAKRVAAPRES